MHLRFPSSSYSKAKTKQVFQNMSHLWEKSIHIFKDTCMSVYQSTAYTTRHVIPLFLLAYCSFEEEACMYDRRIIKRLCCKCCGNHPFLPEMIRHRSCQFHFEFLFLSFLFFFASLTKQIGPFSSFQSRKRTPASLKSIQIRPFVIFS